MHRLIPFSIVGLALLTSSARGAPVVWSGFDFSFSKPVGTDYNLPEFQDRITENVVLTRATTQGLFNVAQESAFTQFTSPADTRWATELHNPGAAIEAANWEALTFTMWTAAYGGANSLSTNIVSMDAVVHLITDDIYLDLRITDWTVGFGGGFAYNRAVADSPSADFNGDGSVNHLDLAIWETHYGATDAAHGDGDSNLDRIVDGSDFLIWQNQSTSSLLQASAPIPEPSGFALVCLMFATLPLTSRQVLR